MLQFNHYICTETVSQRIQRLDEIDEAEAQPTPRPAAPSPANHHEPRPYHHLIERDADGAWSVQFADYHRPTVVQELYDNGYRHNSSPTAMAIVTTFSCTQLGHYKAIQAECAKRLMEHELRVENMLAIVWAALKVARLVAHRHTMYPRAWCLSWDFGETSVGAEGECSRRLFKTARAAIYHGECTYGERAAIVSNW